MPWQWSCLQKQQKGDGCPQGRVAFQSSKSKAVGWQQITNLGHGGTHCATNGVHVAQRYCSLGGGGTRVTNARSSWTLPFCAVFAGEQSVNAPPELCQNACAHELQRAKLVFFSPCETIDKCLRLFGASHTWSETVHYRPLIPPRRPRREGAKGSGLARRCSVCPPHGPLLPSGCKGGLFVAWHQKKIFSPAQQVQQFRCMSSQATAWVKKQGI